MCNSIVAILTLEVTGIPELSENRAFPWPNPSFIEPTRSHLFEVRTKMSFPAFFPLAVSFRTFNFISVYRSASSRTTNVNLFCQKVSIRGDYNLWKGAYELEE